MDSRNNYEDKAISLRLVVRNVQPCRPAGQFLSALTAPANAGTGAAMLAQSRLPLLTTSDFKFRLLAAKFSKSVSVPADSVEWMLADTDNVDPVVFTHHGNFSA